MEPLRLHVVENGRRDEPQASEMDPLSLHVGQNGLPDDPQALKMTPQTLKIIEKQKENQCFFEYRVFRILI